MHELLQQLTQCNIVLLSVLFCRLYFIATSGVCLIRSGTVGFQKKLQSQKEKR
jgi:hypothetical protein